MPRGDAALATGSRSGRAIGPALGSKPRGLGLAWGRGMGCQSSPLPRDSLAVSWDRPCPTSDDAAGSRACSRCPRYHSDTPRDTVCPLLWGLLRATPSQGGHAGWGREGGPGRDPWPPAPLCGTLQRCPTTASPLGEVVPARGRRCRAVNDLQDDVGTKGLSKGHCRGGTWKGGRPRPAPSPPRWCL